MSFVYIHKSGGGQYNLDHVSSKVTERENNPSTAVATVYRDEANSTPLDEGQDEVEIEVDGTSEFTGPLRTIKRKQDRVDLHLTDFELYAKEAPPTVAKLPYQSANDAAIVRDAINNIPDLSAGTIDSTTSGIDIIYQFASRALQIRRVRDMTKAKVRYNSDKTVDYLAPGTSGTDRTGTTLSPSNQNMKKATPKVKGGDNRKTHLQMIGSGGRSVRVEANSYSGGRERWGRAEFLSVGDTDTLVLLAEKLLTELNNEWLEVQTTLTGINDVSLGDIFTVDYPELGINNEELEVVELTKKFDNDGTHYDAVLSNRSFARKEKVAAHRQGAEQASQLARTGQTTVATNIPTVNIPRTTIPPGDSLDQMTLLGQNTTLYLWKTTQSPVSLDTSFKLEVRVNVGLNGNGGTVVYSEETKSYDVGNPLAEVAVDGARVAFRLENTGDTEDSTCAEFYYTIEKDA